MGNRRRRYALRDGELDERIDQLMEEATRLYGSVDGADYVRQILVTGLRLLREDRSSGELKMLNAALKELRHALAVFGPYAHIRKVSVFGSARTPEGAPEWEQARRFGRQMSDAGWMTITGAGDGIMGAAQEGAGRASSFGVNIRLPFEQSANETIEGDSKLINFRYFFTRKVMFVKESHAVALFPGGFGTHDEGHEALTLIQTGKSQLMPVVFVDAPGDGYWREWRTWVERHLLARGLIAEADMALFHVTDDVGEAVDEILGFYRNYHSSRFVGDQLVVRLLHPPSDEQVDALNDEFHDLVVAGRIETAPALEEEEGELEALPRLLLRFDRRRVGRLRLLIDRVNGFAPERAEPPRAPLPREVIAASLSEEAEREEDET